ncbi:MULTISPECIES: LysM peptidoglycan-binding domain-containing protein [unclassified Modicisalibacter]|uniref:LysM peptidoglycan-binding domain-containing protein n=1 Tax=unclassified Modicisalibacter TaxID=2679913 RepID=UPI001CCDEBB9|nr:MULTISPECIES: LysM peptidoglycan-binding domain-containing protein [unclassified Modicisalibacter]MBZ9556713.1 LysM peptidoglycan-binding domain-containing protein [Modicisalibacter sp. R2A 31.J]MBZ9574818.1 LysM peptidoglycan-binding domain-containing protein [Modicisalibacter sp. MOD 31.J]
MTDRSNRRRARYLAGGLLLTLSTLGGAVQAQPDAAPDTFWDALQLQGPTEASLWAQLRSGFQWQVDTGEPRVEHWLDYYRRHPLGVARIAERARPWLYWITQEVERRGMPAEIALLPFIESAFRPTAKNPGGATGLWQLMPGTGDALGLRRDGWYDGRVDVIASTRAALDYLQQQADQWYDGDLELALAAYNAGAGTVNRAMRRAISQGGSGDYWSLSLPRQTMNYVPKLLALSEIIADPERYGVVLPDIPDRPAFARVEVPGQIDLAQAARLAGVSKSKLRALNPGLLQSATLPRRSPALLVPTKARNALVAALASRPDKAMARVDRYRVEPGDTLSAIAARHGIPLSALRRENGIRGNIIRVGQVLRVPLGPPGPDTAGDTLVVQVRPGDSLSRIAAKHDVSVADLARWNELDSDQYLRPGQELTLFANQ